MSLWLLAFVVFAQAVETVAGFGGTVLALALGVHVVPLERLVVALVIVGWLQSAWNVGRGHRAISFRVLLGRILPLAGAGLAAGAFAFSALGDVGLELVLGAFVVVVSALELYRLFRRPAAPRPLHPALSAALLAGGGVFHGLFASGGPLIVLFASRALPEKAAFRATLSALWLTMNTVLLASYALSGRLDRETGTLAASLLPALAVGIVAGEALHARVDELAFRRLSQGILLGVGVLLLVR